MEVILPVDAARGLAAYRGSTWRSSTLRWIKPKRHSGARADSTVIPGRAKREPGISRFRVWSFGPSRNDELEISGVK
jgi:hypothetical protein